MLALCVTVICIASFLETTRFSNRFTDTAPILLISLFFILPITGLPLLILNRKCREEHTEPQRVGMLLARVVIFIGWVISCVPVGFIAVMFQLWPISLRAGPDTDYAREGFEKEIGFKPTSSVSKIYYRSEGFLTDGNGYLRFQSSSPDVVQQIVADRKMMWTDEWNMMKSSSSRLPKWWSEKSTRQGLECYSQKDRQYGPWYYLWYDRDSGTVWYEERDF